MNNNRRKILATILLILVVILGGVSVFVAYRMSTQVAVAPTAPSSQPSATESCTNAGGVCRAGNTCPSGQALQTGTDCATGQSCCVTPQVPWVATPICNTTFNISAPACTIRPACLDASPPCVPPTPVGGYCPSLVCPDGKAVYKDVPGNTPGFYNLDAENRIADGSSVNPGQTLVYSIVYNTTTGTVDHATIDDLLNSKLEFVDSTSECAKQTGSNRVLCNISRAKLAAGVNGGTGISLIRVKVKDSALPGTLPNIATISSSYITNTGAVSTDLSRSMCDATLNITIAPTVAISCKSKTAFDANGVTAINTLGKSQTFTYSMEVTNTGNTAAPQVVVTDSLPTELAFVDSASGCTLESASRVVTCNTSLSAGETKRLTFRVKTGTELTDGAIISNTAVAKVATSTTATGSECSKNLTVAIPKLTALKEAYKDNSNNTPGDYQLTDVITTVSKSQLFTYAIKVTNSGTGTASGIVISDPLTGLTQDQLTFVDKDPRCEWTSTDRLIRCAMDLQPGKSDEIAFRVRVSDAAVNGSIIKNLGTVVHQGESINVTKDLTVSSVVSCNNTCTTNAECNSGLTCDTTASKCRNSLCTSETSCVCPATATEAPTATIAPKATVTAAATQAVTTAPTAIIAAAEPTAAPEVLPETGIFDIPGAAIFGGGLLLAVLGILLAL